jgi:hypothetical protein
MAAQLVASRVVISSTELVSYGTPSLTRGRICNLLIQLLLSLGSAVTLVSKSRRTRDRIVLSYLKTGFPFYRTLQLAELRWMCSNTPPHLYLT